MDSRTLLDYALFQLTPTRTRCDLVIYAGKKNEKIASGLLEPFLSHLKSAKDQISRGGYSITLRPAPSDTSPWFSKATLERFVRFVSTPEVLERLVTIEREIGQIEISVESSEQVNGTVEVRGSASATDGDPKIPVGQSKLKIESNNSGDAEAEEKPKIRLQRVLESRKTMLKKEQAMAYARALVAGFEMDYLYDLVSFSDAFGALRLREACINFMELCNKKNDDKIWMDEVAAMQASFLAASGIMHPGENSDLSHTGLAKSSTSDSITRHGSLGSTEEFNSQQTEGTAQLPTWAPHLPQYMHNTQGPIFQQIPPYPGHIFPGMQVAPSHYPGNVPWLANFQDPGMYLDRDIKDSQRYHSSTKKKGKHANREPARHVKNGEPIGTDQSSSQSDSSGEREEEPSLSSQGQIHNKKLNRHPSKKVVIRNINYITSGRNEESGSASDSRSSGEDEYVDAGSLKQQVEEAIGSLKRHQKPTTHKNKARDGSKKASNKSEIGLDMENAGSAKSQEERKDGNWDIFQNLLMRDSDPASTDMGSKTMQVQEEEYSMQKASLAKKFDKPKYASDDFLLTERSTGNDDIAKANIKSQGRENVHGVVKRSIKDEELLIPPRMEGVHYLQNAHLGNESSIIKTQQEEDWLIGSKPEISAGSGWSRDHSIFHGDQSSTNHVQTGEIKRDVLVDDSFMVQSRLSDGPLQTQPKVDIFMVSDTAGASESTNSVPANLQGKVEASNCYEPEDLYMMLGRDSAAVQVGASWDPAMDYGKDISQVETVGSQGNIQPTTGTDSALLRNSNKSNNKISKEPGGNMDRKAPKPKAPSGYFGRSKSDTPSRSKVSAGGTKMIRNKAEQEKEKRKKTEELLLQRQKRIAERSAAKGFNPDRSKRSSKESKKHSVATRVEKAKPQGPTDENKTSHKPVMRSSTISRLAAARTTNNQLSTESKVGQDRKSTSKGNSLMAASSLKKGKGNQERQDKVNRSDKKTDSRTNSRSSDSNIQERDCVGTVPSISEDSTNAEGTSAENVTEDFGTIKVLHTVTSVEKRETNVLPLKEAADCTNSIQVSSDKDSLHTENSSKQGELHGNTDDHVGVTPQTTVYPAVGNALKSSGFSISEKGDEKKKISFSPEISVVDISTSPPNETNPELTHSRKKWNNGEGSPRIPKGFRKLLLFGRRF